ncbi:hypothetical protein AAG570_005727 [Ranatra chinensis]|uniref:Uncharacterized protein n=1 Tax=Ranatra chinensis TaxID=642074 RepID=A0ABD0XZ87_9HEMI
MEIRIVSKCDQLDKIKGGNDAMQGGTPLVTLREQVTRPKRVQGIGNGWQSIRTTRKTLTSLNNDKLKVWLLRRLVRCYLGCRRLLREMGDSILKEGADQPPDLKSLFGPLECKLCGVKSESTLAAMSHYRGRPHTKKLNAYLRAQGSAPQPSQSKKSKASERASCQVCSVVLTSAIQADQHYAGKAHAKNLRAAAKGSAPKVAPLPPARHDPTGRFGIGSSFLERPNATEEPSTAPPMLPSPPDYFCYTCGVPTTGPDQLEAHAKGVRHIKKLKLAETSTAAAHQKDLSMYRTPSDQYYCPQCDSMSNSPDQFLQHVESKRHKRNTKPKTT